MSSSFARDVFIMGTPFSGSTFLANALNAHSQVFSAGELSSCFADFPFGVKNAFCPVCAAKGETCAVFSPDFMDKLGHAGKANVLAEIRREVNKPVLVDGSKFPLWFKQVLDAREPESLIKRIFLRPQFPNVRVILLTRSPFGFLNSVSRRESVDIDDIMEQWCASYQNAKRLILLRGLAYQLVKFEQLLGEPTEVLSALCGFIGIPFEKQLLKFWEVPIHSLGGNAGGFMWFADFAEHGEFETPDDELRARDYADRQFSAKKTDSWRDMLSQDEIKAVVDNKKVRKVAAKLNYNLVEMAVLK